MAAVGITAALIIVAALFALFIAARALQIKVCAACAAFATTWLLLLALSYRGVPVDPLLIGVLMGGSVVGVLYLLKEKLPEEYHLFTLPYLATFFPLAYILLGGRGEPGAYIIIALLWAVFGVVFLARKNTGWKSVAEKLITCCKNW